MAIDLISAAERSNFLRYFRTCLCHLAEFELYWLPAARRLAARSVGASKVHPVPGDAVLIGTYGTRAAPKVQAHDERGRFKLVHDDFLGDLADILARSSSDADGPGPHAFGA